MKKTKFYSFMLAAVVAMSSVVYFNSCTPDPCKDVVCNNGGTCVEGICSCLTGYEGTNCDTKTRDMFLGSYNTSNETCTSGGPSSFGITVTAGATDLEINIANVYGAGFNTKANVQADKSIVIANQAFGTGSVEGSGSVSGNTLTLSYTITGGGVSDICNNVTFIK
jgi:hypothetical protein